VLKGKKLVKDLNNSEEICAQARQKYVSSRKTQQKSDETYKALKVKGVQKNIEKVCQNHFFFLFKDALRFVVSSLILCINSNTKLVP
jgi:hypothetical protein